MADAAIPYEEPGIVTILTQASFLLALNIVSSMLDSVFYCGLVGQVLIGMAWGTPGAKILPHQFEEVATQLGYLGLIVIVFEGGLATSFKSVRANLLLSICVALTGIMLPMAFSFSLMALANASKLQAFAAGSALCSTSLGTTFSILKTIGLTNSRLGTVLTSAAMLDDVVGLIMVQIISNLGSGNESIEATTVVRPVFVSVGFALILPLACYFLVNPILHLYSKGQPKTGALARANHLVSDSSIHFLLSTALLVGLVCAASYAGTSALFAAYLAGASTTWLDDSLAQIQAAKSAPSDHGNLRAGNGVPTKAIPEQARGSGSQQKRSDEGAIGTSSRQLVNAGGITSADSKRLPTPPPESGTAGTEGASSSPESSTRALESPEAQSPERESRSLNMYNTYYGFAVERILKPFFFASIGFSIPITKMFRGPIVWRGFVYALLMAIGKLFCGVWLVRFAKTSATPSATSHQQEKSRSSSKYIARPKSLYPASLLGCAMVARGEIGFLISALAASNGIFNPKDAPSSSGSINLESDIYLIVIWAILLCTIVGPVALGFLARRVKRLQAERAKSGAAGGQNPLGMWGVS